MSTAGPPTLPAAANVSTQCHPPPPSRRPLHRSPPPRRRPRRGSLLTLLALSPFSVAPPRMDDRPRRLRACRGPPPRRPSAADPCTHLLILLSSALPRLPAPAPRLLLRSGRTAASPSAPLPSESPRARIVARRDDARAEQRERSGPSLLGVRQSPPGYCMPRVIGSACCRHAHSQDIMSSALTVKELKVKLTDLGLATTGAY